MATVTLSWEVEGTHDGIGVYRSAKLTEGFELIATLAPNTKTFSDDFLLSQLTSKYGVKPSTLFYKLTTFRGGIVKEGDVLPVPLADTMPVFLSGVGYLDEVPEVKGTTLATYYSIGSHILGGRKYHILAGVHNDESHFIHEPVFDVPFTSLNEYLRALPIGASSLNNAVGFTSMARSQHVLGIDADAKYNVLRSMLDRSDVVFEILPTRDIFTQLSQDITALTNHLNITGSFWTATLEAAARNEYGQVSEIDVWRHAATGGGDKVSLASGAKAKTITLMLIDDIT